MAARKGKTERELEAVFGDLHHLIPYVASDKGQEACARLLSEESGLYITQNWVHRWLTRNGYELSTRYVRMQKESA